MVKNEVNHDIIQINELHSNSFDPFKKRICVISFSISESGITPLKNLFNILDEIKNEVYSILCNAPLDHFKNSGRSNVYGIIHGKSTNPFSRVFFFTSSQIKIVKNMIKIEKNIDEWLFFVGSDTQVLPMLFAKVSGKPVFLLFANSSTLTLHSQSDGLSSLIRPIVWFNRSAANKIIVYSPRMIPELGLEGLWKKIDFAYEHLSNPKLTIINDYRNRENVIGFVGRFSIEKGILELIDSISIVVKINPKIHFVLIGDGPLNKMVHEKIIQLGLQDYIDLLGWVKNEDLVLHYNNFKLLIIPSYTEGLPNVMIEAMSCGTPVVANKVGAIPDFIKDGVNGYILDANDPQTIASKILTALKDPNLSSISSSTSGSIADKFQYDRVIENWKRLFDNEI